MVSKSWIEELKTDSEFMEQVTKWTTLPAREGRYEPLPVDLDSRLRTAIAARGVDRLYSHQAQSWAAVRGGENVCLVTPTASGKTLSYNLPVIQTILENKDARALYLFPTKALSNDQQAVLNTVSLAGAGIKVATFDGDTPSSLRASARETGQIIITNPDMLHAGILPNHTKWVKFFKAVSYVVIDELHTYRGVFGSHMANLVRRFRRVLDFYGARPQFFVCSATIANPQELASRICGVDFTLIDDNGAPAGEKHIVAYNPPIVDRVQGIRRGTVNEAQNLALKLLKRGIKTIVFARSRVRVELISSYINQALSNHYIRDRRIRVESYRGGHLPSERKYVEKGLRDGDIQGVVSTNALELGIDIGGLDAAVLAGYPGSIASFWQQGGRAGRSLSASLVVFIAGSAPLDQYVVEHSDFVLGSRGEAAHVNPENAYIAADHIRCAAFELPFRQGDKWFPGMEEYLDNLAEHGILRKTADTWYWADRSYPSETISLRSATNENITIIDTTGGRNTVIGEMDRPSAKELIFPRAVYLHRGQQFTVTSLDLETRRCEVVQSDVNYYTDAVVKTDLKVLETDDEFVANGMRQVLCDVLVRSEVGKFKKLKFHSHENIGYGEIHLPEEQMHTRALALVFDPATPAASLFAGLDAPAQTSFLAGLGYVLTNVLPAWLLTAPGDVRTSERVRDPHFEVPTIFLYEAYPGGTGLSESCALVLGEVLAAAAARVSDCTCKDGCPSCVGVHAAETEVGVPAKQLVLSFLRKALEVQAHRQA